MKASVVVDGMTCEEESVEYFLVGGRMKGARWEILMRE
jgi:hypothetical protein